VTSHDTTVASHDTTAALHDTTAASLDMNVTPLDTTAIAAGAARASRTDYSYLGHLPNVLGSTLASAKQIRRRLAKTSAATHQESG
jgi:hypothetical protein